MPRDILRVLLMFSVLRAPGIKIGLDVNRLSESDAVKLTRALRRYLQRNCRVSGAPYDREACKKIRTELGTIGDLAREDTSSPVEPDEEAVQEEAEPDGRRDEEQREGTAEAGKGGAQVEGNDPAEAQPQGRNADQVAAQTRLLALLAHLSDEDPVSADELSALVIQPPTARHYSLIEDPALARAIRGYQQPDDGHGWGYLVSPPTSHDLSALCLESIELQDESLDVRILKRLGALQKEPNGVIWLFELYRKIEVLRFQHDYEAKHTGNGGKVRQAAFIHDLFEAWLPLDKKQVTEIRNKKDPTYRAEWDKFKFWFTEQGRERVRLQEMYHALGPAVLLDPA
ncbi:hypothetical protein OF83DRAFT_238282, partial [Amylostereum chailletii]